MVIYISSDKKDKQRTMATDLKKSILTELIDEAILGVAIVDKNGVPIIHHLPNTLTAKSLRAILNLVGFADSARKLSDEMLGNYQYLIIRYTNFKLAAFNLPGEKGWVFVFVNPLWHVENVVPKIRQFLFKLSQTL